MKNQPATPIDPSDLLTKTEAAAHLKTSVRSIERNSSVDFRGAAPLPKYKVGGLVRYSRKDLDAFPRRVF